MASIEKVSGETLRDWLQGPNPPALVDVGGWSSDGHIKGSIDLPFSKFLVYLPWLREQIHDKKRVVFYCGYGCGYGGEGASCARYFARYVGDDEHDIFVLDEDRWDCKRTLGSEFWTDDRYPTLFE